MKVRATLKLKNELAVAARERLGLTQKEVAAQARVKQTDVSRLECLQFRDVSNDVLQNLASFYGLEPEDLVPPDLRTEKVGNSFTLQVDIPASRLLSLRDGKAISASAPMEQGEGRDVILRAIGSLDSFREREVLKLRYGLDGNDEHTLEEVGKVFRVTRARVEQIEKNAIRKLRRPSKAKPIEVEFLK